MSNNYTLTPNEQFLHISNILISLKRALNECYEVGMIVASCLVEQQIFHTSFCMFWHPYRVPILYIK